jgi:pimeloyl-ACP methyl ester carboxylesterase
MPKLHIPGYFNWKKFTWVPSHSIEYYIAGEGETVVCAHASTRNLHDFDYLARKLSSQYRTLLFDFAGRGESEWFPDSKHYNYYIYVKDCIYLLKKLSSGPVHWIGTSMGGIVGMVIASLMPKRIKSLVLNDIGAEIPVKSAKKIQKYLELDPSFSNFDEVLEYCKMAYSKFGITKPEHWEHLAKHTVKSSSNSTYKLKFDPKIGRDMKSSSSSTKVSLWKWWNGVKCPSLVISGSESDILLPETIQKMQSSKGEVEHYTIFGAGHAPALFEEKHLDTIMNWISVVSS